MEIVNRSTVSGAVDKIPRELAALLQPRRTVYLQQAISDQSANRASEGSAGSALCQDKTGVWSALQGSYHNNHSVYINICGFPPTLATSGNVARLQEL